MHLGVIQRVIDHFVNKKVKSSLESETSKDSQWIIFECDQGVERSSDDLVMYVRNSFFGPVLYLLSIDIVEERVDSEISSQSISERRSHFLNNDIFTI